MAIRNIPASDCTCDALRLNIQIATGLGHLTGDASSYGAFSAAMDLTQDRTLNALDPRDCSNKIYKVGATDNYGVTLEYHTQDCTPMVEECKDWSCDPFASATPTSNVEQFEIDQCIGFGVTIKKDEWFDSCCGVEEYYKNIAMARMEGKATANFMQSTIDRAMNDIVRSNRMYEAKLVAEKMSMHFNNPSTGILKRLNEYVLDKLDAGAGYNHALDPATGDIVGDALAKIPAFYPQAVGCAIGAKQIDADALRRYMEDWVSRHPNCSTENLVMIGGYSIQALLREIGIASCCDDKGMNQAEVMRRATSYLSKFKFDSTIDAKFGDGTFFLVEENTLAMFWLNLWDSPLYNRPNDYLFNGKYVEKIKGFRDVTTTGFAVGNCRDGYMSLPFDTFFNTKQVLACDENHAYNFQFKSQYGLWTRPATGCADFNPRTGIYKFQITDICPTV